MTSALGSAPAGRRLRGFATRRPEWFAVLAALVYMLPLLGARLVVPQAASVAATWNLVQAAQFAWMIVLPAVLLTVLGWWGVAGFTRRSTRRSLVPFLPLILLYLVVPVVVLLLPALSDVAGRSVGYVTLVAVAALAVGFGDEATFRGVVLQTLLPRGTRRAVIISSVLYGARYLGTVAAGVDPVLVGVQALHMVGIGVAFAAVVVVTGTIRPLVLITAVTQVWTLVLPEGTTGPDVVTMVIELVMGTLAAAYGIWLLHRHRHRHRHADHAGKDGPFSAPRNHRQPEVKPRGGHAGTGSAVPG